MKLIYENSVGRVTLRGGTDAIYNITVISGLSIPETLAETVRYPGVAGQEVTAVSHLPRTITIAGDICDKTGKHTAFAANVFSKSGTVYIATSRSMRKIGCRPLSFLPAKRKGTYVPFTLQLIADNPYFEDTAEPIATGATKTKLLKAPFILPQAFSNRKSEARVINRGSVPIEPEFKISAAKEASCPNGILIENRTTGAKLKLHTGLLENETIVIDIGNRKITGSVQGNLIGVLSVDTPMSKFTLCEGVNDILITAEDEAATLFAYCHYQNRYAEAVL